MCGSHCWCVKVYAGEALCEQGVQSCLQQYVGMWRHVHDTTVAECVAHAYVRSIVSVKGSVWDNVPRLDSCQKHGRRACAGGSLDCSTSITAWVLLHHLLLFNFMHMGVHVHVHLTFAIILPPPFPGRYYQFGGSTNILVLPPNTVTFDTDLVANSKAGVETWVPMGDHIGMRHATNAK